MNVTTSRGGLSRRHFMGAMAAGISFAAAPGLRAQGAPAGVLRMGLSSYPANLQPWMHAGTAAGAVKLAIHRGLFGYDATGKVRPELVEEYTRDDATTWTFKLRKAVFHNGDPVDADAVKYMLDQIGAESSTAYLKAGLSIIEVFEKIDDQSFRLKLKEPSETLLYHFANFNGAIISPKSTEDEIIGCGPYRITGLERGAWIRCEAFDGYYKPGLPKTPVVEFRAYPDEDSRVTALESGDVDLIEFVPWHAMDRIAEDSRFRLDAVDGACLGLTFNFKQGPFTDKRIRQAVAYAVDRKGVLDAAFYGHGSELPGLPVPKSSFAYNAELQNHWARNLDKARQLMQEAGAAGGITATLLSTAQYGMHRAAAEVTQQSLMDIGILVTLELPDYATRMQLGNRGQFEFSVTGYPAPYDDPDSLSVLLNPNPNGSYLRSYGYENARVGELLTQARGTPDQAGRKALYDEVVSLALEDAAFVGLTWRSDAFAMKAAVNGFHNMPGPATIFSPSTLEETTV